MWIPTLVIFGIRHKRLFGFLGRAGDVIDAIIQLQGTGPFPENCFKHIRWPSQISARVQNEDETIAVDCNTDGVVLSVDLQETGLTHESVKRAFTEVSALVLRITGGDKSIDRIGIMNNYVFESGAPGRVAIHALTKIAGVGEPADFSMRASFRTPTEGAMVLGKVNDWKNTILQIGSDKREENSPSPDILRVSIDYQIYFEPKRKFEPGLIDQHYADFLSRIAKLQQERLAGVAEAPEEK